MRNNREYLIASSSIKAMLLTFPLLLLGCKFSSSSLCIFASPKYLPKKYEVLTEHGVSQNLRVVILGLVHLY